MRYKALYQEINKHRLESPQVEICGYINKAGEYVRGTNISQSTEDEFVLDKEISDDVVAIVHSHTKDHPSYLSVADLLAQKMCLCDFLLVDSDGEFLEVSNEDFLVGRLFEYGIYDCYSLVERAYELMGLDLPHVVRTTYEEDVKNEVFIKAISRSGLEMVDINEADEGDILVMGNKKINHVALNMGDGYMLHHQMDYLSMLEFINDRWLEKIKMVLRHKDYKKGLIQAVFNDIEAGKQYDCC